MPGVRSIALLLALGLAFAGCSGGPQRVVLVSIDTLRADRVGAYGYEGAATPTLDALAGAGARFETALSPAPLTLPSHATLLTGLDPHEPGVRHNGVFRLADDVRFAAKRGNNTMLESSATVPHSLCDGTLELLF